MTETHVPLPPIVPPRFNVIPYCDPNRLYASTLDVLLDYDPAAVAAKPDLFLHLSAAYEDVKQGEEGPEPDRPTFDLSQSDHLESMVAHTLMHAAAGLLDAGTSNTDCIPYWDRDALRVSYEYHDPKQAASRLELIDVLSINALRMHCSYGPRWAGIHKLRIELLEAAHAKGQRSTVDIRPKQEGRIDHNKVDLNLYTDLFIAKFRHLIWLVDQQRDERIRHEMLGELEGYVGQADALGIDKQLLSVDMGIDTGISGQTGRPLYDISHFVQLQHIHDPEKPWDEQTFSLPQGECHHLSLSTLLSSIGRNGSDLPFYEQDGRYRRLPWRFEGSD